MTYFINRASDSIYGNNPKPTDKSYKIEKWWYIDINTIEDLKNLIEKEDTIIVSKDSIQIYDDYIE